MSKKKQMKTITPSELKSIPATSQEVTPMVMMQMAVAQGAPVEQMERLWELNVKVEAANARKAFFEALAQFKKNPPRVIKDKLNAQYGSDYVGIGNMVTTASESMGQFGLTHSWGFGEGQNGEIICTCVMSHELGHQESVTLSSPIDISGKKNPLQGRKSTRTYLKLETFEAVTGMVSVSGNIDDDGNSANVEYITEAQANEIHARITEHDINMTGFMKWLKQDLKCELIEGISVKALSIVNARIDSAIRAQKKDKK